jgi:hypothetical protein
LGFPGSPSEGVAKIERAELLGSLARIQYIFLRSSFKNCPAQSSITVTNVIFVGSAEDRVKLSQGASEVSPKAHNHTRHSEESLFVSLTKKSAPNFEQNVGYI